MSLHLWSLFSAHPAKLINLLALALPIAAQSPEATDAPAEPAADAAPEAQVFIEWMLAQIQQDAVTNRTQVPARASGA